MTLADQFLAAIAPALRSSDQNPGSGTDPSGAVTVDVAAGGALTRVAIVDTWARHGGGEALAGAVLMANATATAAAMGLSVDSDAVRSYRPGSGAEMLSDMVERAQRAEPDTRAASEALARLVRSQPMPAPMTPAEAVDAFARLEARQQTGTLTREGLREVADPQRYVVLTLDPAGSLIDISISDHWADGKSGKAIAGRINDLVLSFDRTALS